MFKLYSQTNRFVPILPTFLSFWNRGLLPYIKVMFWYASDCGAVDLALAVSTSAITSKLHAQINRLNMKIS